MRPDGKAKRSLLYGFVGGAVWGPGSELAWQFGGRDEEFGYGDGRQGLYIGPTGHPDKRRLSESAFGLPDWHPSGTSFAMASSAGGYGGCQSRVFEMDATTGEGRRVVMDDDCAAQPSWSPNGRRLAYVSVSDEAPGGFSGAEIFVVNRDGSGERQLTRNRISDSEPEWSPDGRWIAYIRDGSLYVMRPDGSRKRRVVRNAMSPVWQPRPR